MKKSTQEIESQLQQHSIAELDDALLDRLEAAAEGTLTELTASELDFEAKLKAIQPQGLSPALLQKLENQVEGLPAPSQVHVIPFKGSHAALADHQTQDHRTSRTPSWMSAAAAVALLGILSAWWLDPIDHPSQDLVKKPTQLVDPNTAVPASSAEFSRALAHTQDQGIIWGDNQEPHRVIKVTYTDRMSMKRDDGSTYQVEQPRVEYYLLPADSH